MGRGVSGTDGDPIPPAPTGLRYQLEEEAQMAGRAEGAVPSAQTDALLDRALIRFPCLFTQLMLKCSPTSLEADLASDVYFAVPDE